jgi:hypothetical protein
MCEFLSVVSDGKGNPYYFDYEIRKKIIAGELDFETDSHASIIEHFFGKESDTRTFHGSRLFNQYEYNPLTKAFKTDQINGADDSTAIKEFCLNLDFKTVVPELQIKEIINPKNVIHGDLVNDSEKALLMMWDSVWASVRASVGDSVRASVGDSVGDSVWDSVWASVRASVGASVRASVWASVWAYISDFFTIANWKYVTHEPDKNPFQPCIDLWMLGLVPSFDGKTWRLHNMSNNAEVIYEWVK